MLIKRIVLAIFFGLLASSSLAETVVQNNKSKKAAVHSGTGNEQNLGVKVYAQAAPSVVLIRSFVSSKPLSQGSGVAFAQVPMSEAFAGITWIATNAHVVKGASEVRIYTAGRTYEATIEYADADLDLALLTLSGVSLPSISPSSAEQTNIGEKVYAIGSPLGMINSITEGIISGKRKSNNADLIQTSAAISPGNSGGALLDSNAHLIGITTSKLASAENINFAIDAKYIILLKEALYAARKLSIVAAGMSDLTPNEIAILSSGPFTKWILSQKTEDGTQVYEKILEIFDQVPLGEMPSEKITKQLLLITRKFFDSRASQVSAPSSPEQSSTLKLVCAMYGRNNRREKDFNLELDTARQIANGYKATVTESEVRWIIDDKYLWELNRYSGTIAISTRELPDILKGSCATAGERKF